MPNGNTNENVNVYENENENERKSETETEKEKEDLERTEAARIVFPYSHSQLIVNRKQKILTKLKFKVEILKICSQRGDDGAFMEINVKSASQSASQSVRPVGWGQKPQKPQMTSGSEPYSKLSGSVRLTTALPGAETAALPSHKLTQYGSYIFNFSFSFKRISNRCLFEDTHTHTHTHTPKGLWDRGGQSEAEAHERAVATAARTAMPTTLKEIS